MAWPLGTCACCSLIISINVGVNAASNQHKHYLIDILLAHQHSNSTSIPWDEIVLNPAKYYNTAASYFSANLDHPQNLSTVQVVNLVNDLLSTSTMKNLTPFHFLGTEGTVLVPETPPITPAVLAIPPPPLLEHPSQQAPVAPVSLDPPPASPLAGEVDERHLVKSRDKSKRQRFVVADSNTPDIC